jgi:hypothetical protein
MEGQYRGSVDPRLRDFDRRPDGSARVGVHIARIEPEAY